ncbi:MAG: hypothetical protein H0T42_26070 [Deltaproteobacteria bacterium]|nr:hypothetical protein [Deltaproteobacteria bacterium]
MRRLLLALVLSLSACQPAEPPGHLAASALGIREPELLLELRAMVNKDQAARNLSIDHPDDIPLVLATAAIDHANTTRMKEIIAHHGWPGHRLVGHEGAGDAWLLVQHADADRAFQKLCLARLAVAVAAGDADPIELAYLEDRVAVADGRPQRFGTQFGADGPQPIVDEDNVDERRAAVGLGSMEEYRREMRATYGPR